MSDDTSGHEHELQRAVTSAGFRANLGGGEDLMRPLDDAGEPVLLDGGTTPDVAVTESGALTEGGTIKRTSTVVVPGHRSLVTRAAAIIVAGIGWWALGGPMPWTFLADRSNELEASPYWSDSSTGVRVVDVSGLVAEPDLTEPSASAYQIIDIGTLPSNFVVRSEFLLAERQAVVEEPATYRQDIHAVTPSGSHVFFEVRSQAGAGALDFSSGLPLIGEDWQSETIRGVEGSVNGGDAEWFEPGVGLVRIRSDESLAAVLDMAEALVFVQDNEVPVRNRRRATSYESTAATVLSGPEGGWTFDAAEVLVVAGVPGSTGRLPFTATDEAVAFVVVAGDEAAVAGVAPASVTSFRILTIGGETTQIPTVASPTNADNALFAFGLTPGLEAARVELLNDTGQIADSFTLPTAFYEQARGSVSLD